jgi:hypothetical protein
LRARIEKKEHGRQREIVALAVLTLDPSAAGKGQPGSDLTPPKGDDCALWRAAHGGKTDF